MRKSNWLTLGVAFLVSIILLGVWWGFGFSKVDGVTDIVATAIWWAAIITAGVAISLAEKKRRERMRTVFIAPNVLYNPETGFVLIDDEQPVVAYLQKMLDSLQYPMSPPKPSERLHPRFTHIVRTRKYKKGAKVWEGEVARAAHPENTRQFYNRDELVAIFAIAVKPPRRERTR